MKQTAIRIITGLIIIAIGVGALLGALNIFPFWDSFWKFWPLLVILGGIFVWLGDWRRNYIWGIVLIIIGALLQLKTLGYLDFNFFSLIVPIVLIAVGLTVVLQVQSRGKVERKSTDVDDISVIFSGSETKNKSKDYRGGNVTAIFGGATLDLRDAKLTKDATLDVFILFSGLELKVPRDWKVVSKAAPIAGGVENKSEGTEDHKGPVLTITGTVALGGVEIKT